MKSKTIIISLVLVMFLSLVSVSAWSTTTFNDSTSSAIITLGSTLYNQSITLQNPTYEYAITYSNGYIYTRELGLTNQLRKYYINGTYTGTNLTLSNNGINGMNAMSNDNTYFYILYNAGERVYKYYLNGTYKEIIYFDTSIGGDTLSQVGGFDIDSSGNFWVSDVTEGKVYKFYPNGTYTGTNFTHVGTYSPYGIMINNNIIYVGEDEANIYSFNLTSLNHLNTYNTTNWCTDFSGVFNNTFICNDEFNYETYLYYLPINQKYISIPQNTYVTNTLFNITPLFFNPIYSNITYYSINDNFIIYDFEGSDENWSVNNGNLEITSNWSSIGNKSLYSYYDYDVTHNLYSPLINFSKYETLTFDYRSINGDPSIDYKVHLYICENIESSPIYCPYLYSLSNTTFTSTEIDISSYDFSGYLMFWKPNCDDGSCGTEWVHLYLDNLILELNNEQLLNFTLNSLNNITIQNTLQNQINTYLGSCSFVSGYCQVPLNFYAEYDQIFNINSLNFNNTGFIENSQYYSSSTLDTSIEDFILNMSFDSNTYTPTVYLNYDGTNYLASSSDIGNNRNYSVSLSIPHINETTNKSFYWSVQNVGGTYQTSELNQTVIPINFSLCDGLITPYIIFDFIDELTLSSINATIRTSTFEYYIDDSSNPKTYSYGVSSNSSNYRFCFSPNTSQVTVDMNIQYYGDGYPERTYGNTLNLTNVSTNVTLSLLDDGSGLYATFKFIDSITDVGLSNVDVRIYDGTTLVIQKTTDSSGLISEFLNPNILYTIYYSKSGYSSDSEGHRPTSTDTIYIEMDSTSLTATPSLVNGLIAEIYPSSVNLVNNTVYLFGFYASEGDQEIDFMNYTIYDENNSIIGSRTRTGEGNMTQISLNTYDNKSFRGEYVVCGIEGDCITFYRTYYISLFSPSDYSLKAWGLSFNTYFPSETRTTLTRLIWFVIWFITMFSGFNFGYNGSFKTKEDQLYNVRSETRGNTTNGLLFAFLITLLFSYFNLIPIPLIGAVDINFLGISSDWVEQNFIALIILMVLIWDVIGGIFKHTKRGT